MTVDETIRAALAEAVAMPAELAPPAPRGVELRARARRSRTERRLKVLGTVVIVAALATTTVLLRPGAGSHSPVNAGATGPQKLTTAVNVSSVRTVTTGPCQLGWTPSFSGDQCYGLTPEGTASAPTNLRLLNVAAARLVTPSQSDAESGRARIVLSLDEKDARTLGQLYHSGATLAVSVSGRMIVGRLAPSSSDSALVLEAPGSTINWAWSALTAVDPDVPPQQTFWRPPDTCSGNPPVTQPSGTPQLGHGAGPLRQVCVPTTGAGFRNRLLETQTSLIGTSAADIRQTAVAQWLISGAEQPDASFSMIAPTAQQTVVQVAFAGYFATHGDPMHTRTIIDRVTALGAPAVVVAGDNPGSVCVLVSIRAYDVSACGSGRFEKLAPITTDQLVAIIDSVRGLD